MMRNKELFSSGLSFNEIFRKVLNHNRSISLSCEVFLYFPSEVFFVFSQPPSLMKAVSHFADWSVFHFFFFFLMKSSFYEIASVFFLLSFFFGLKRHILIQSAVVVHSRVDVFFYMYIMDRIIYMRKDFHFDCSENSIILNIITVVVLYITKND